MTFFEYVDKINNCKSIDIKIRSKAAKRLLYMFNLSPKNAYLKDIHFCKMNKNPKLCGMFDWAMTKEGYSFWEKIAKYKF